MEWLANISVKWVLVAVGVLMVALTLVRFCAPKRDPTAAWLVENLQVGLSVVVVVFLVIRPFLFQAFYIPSSSMEPTLRGPGPQASGLLQDENGDRLIVNKLIYLVSNPRRLDIVVFKAPPAASPDEKEFIKRVIGLPGETVEVVPPRLLLDGRVALKLTSEGDRFGMLQVQNLPVRVRDHTAELTVQVRTLENVLLKVIVRPDPQPKYDPYRVELMGTVELMDDAGRIRAEGRLTDYGADPGIRGTLYTVDGDPRLAVLKGERLKYDPGHVRVNGRRLAEPYIKEPPRYAMAPRKLGPREYFMMGDNRNSSNDSHVWGPLTRERMIGRAEIIFWPLNRAAILHWWLIGFLAALFIGYQLLLRALPPR